MTVAAAAVNDLGAESVLKPKLTLSAVAGLAHDPDRTPTVVLEDHGYPLIEIGRVPAEASVRDERDPWIETEAELRYAWGDR